MSENSNRIDGEVAVASVVPDETPNIQELKLRPGGVPSLIPGNDLGEQLQENEALGSAAVNTGIVDQNADDGNTDDVTLANEAIPDTSGVPATLTKEEEQAIQVERDVQERLKYKAIGSEVFCLKTIKYPKDRLLACKDVRWMHNDAGTFKPFKGKDSILIEIKHRIDNKWDLDYHAQEVLEKKLNHIYGKKETPIKVTHQEEDGAELSEQEKNAMNQKKVLVLNRCYSVNDDCTGIDNLYWKEHREIQRGYYFTSDNKPVKPEIADAINKHLKEFYHTYKIRSKEKYPKQQLPDPLDLTNEKVLLEWSSLVDFTINRERGLHKVYQYFEMADMKDKCSKIEHLVFVVHGVGHDEGEHLVTDCAKSLTRSVEKANEKGGILFIPIHWRTAFVNDGHGCNEICSMEVHYLVNNCRLFHDARLYSCTKHAEEIKRIVINEINKKYETFMFHNPYFKGTVSIFGHSLGSVISYDILTDKIQEKKKRVQSEVAKETSEGGEQNEPVQLKVDIKRIFIVGSPLKTFLERRGDDAVNLLLKAIGNYQIYNIYHPNDFIADRIEPLTNNVYMEQEPIQLPLIDPNHSQSLVGVQWALSYPKWMYNSVWNYFKPVENGLSEMTPTERYKSRIDHVLEKNRNWTELYSHSIYWCSDEVGTFLVNELYKRGTELVDKEIEVRIDQTEEPGEIAPETSISPNGDTALTVVHTYTEPSTQPISNDEVPAGYEIIADAEKK